VMPSLKWAVLAASASLLVACGGSNEGTPNGAIAYNPATGDAAIYVNATTEGQARSEAVRNCGTTACDVVLTFSGDGVCGAIALSANGVIGVAKDDSDAEAEVGAVTNCQAKGGSSCYIPAAVRGDCNG